MHNLAFSVLFLAACGSDSGSKVDASNGGEVPAVDAAIDAPAGAPSCATYCTAIMANCTATRQQYTNATDCMNSCMHFPVGTLNQTSMNTVGCRQYHADAAAADPATHCKHAGPSGAGVCGTLCEGFCSIGVAVCPTQAGNAGQCAAACAGYANAGMDYSSAIQSGNTKECRMYHSTAAATNPGGHCAHIAATSVTCN